jgi:hypothetical protein
MDMTIVLAKALGIIFVVMGISIISNKKSISGVLADLEEDPGFLWIAGLMALLIGAFMVAVHNTWGSGFQTVISLIGWLSIIKGTVMLVIPDASMSIYKKVAGNMALTLSGYAVLIIGLVLLYEGFV